MSGPDGFRSLLLGVPKGQKLVPIGRLGTGFPNTLLSWLQPRLRELETDTSPFSGPIPKKPMRKLHWIKPELVAEVEFANWTDDKVVRQASLKAVTERGDRKVRPDWINLPKGLEP